jgi:hypothetical protein
MHRLPFLCISLHFSPSIKYVPILTVLSVALPAPLLYFVQLTCAGTQFAFWSSRIQLIGLNCFPGAKAEPQRPWPLFVRPQAPLGIKMRSTAAILVLFSIWL